MMMRELMEKADKIDELAIKHYNVFKEIYYYVISTKNEDVREHLEKIMNNVNIEDAYHITTNRWIQKSVVDDIVNTIQYANKYEDINYETIDYSFIDLISYAHEEDMTTEVFIDINTSIPFDTSCLRDLIAEKLKEIDELTIQKKYGYRIYIKHEKIDAKEKCKHSCKAQYRINKINEIFEL